MKKRIVINDELERTLQAIESAWTEGASLSGHLPGRPEQQAALSRFLSDVLRVQNFARALSKGDLAQELQTKGLMAGSLKSLQANLTNSDDRQGRF
jgi:hypothetical protein